MLPYPLLITAMGGFGDTMYQRPLIRHFLEQTGELWVRTPYPELLSDLPGVHPVPWAEMRLRCQQKNMARFAGWSEPPEPHRRLRLAYGLGAGSQGIIRELEQRTNTKIADFHFDLPEFAPPARLPPLYAVVRPVSVRREWMNSARNPDPRYVAAAATALMKAGIPVICVGDLDEEQEKLQGDLPPADIYWTRGELTTPDLLGLVRKAAIVVGGVGWIVPATMAYRTPAVIVCGGLGKHNHPALLTDSRMGERPIRFLMPDPYCMCRHPRHECAKTIPDFPARFREAMAEVA